MDSIIATGVVPIFVKYLSCNEIPKLQVESAWALTNISSGTAEQVPVNVECNE